MLFWEELDPLTAAVQQAIDADNGFNSEHIFYKIIKHSLKSLQKSNQFEWPLEIIQFFSSLEAHGGQKVCNLLRGPGKVDKQYDENKPMMSLNIPLPTKTTRQRRKQPSLKSNGVIGKNLETFMNLCQATPPIVTSTQVRVVPICLARDAMAIKPSGDLDLSSNLIVGLAKPIDLQFVKDNPYPEPDIIRENLYTEAGAIIASTLDNKASLHIAHDFLLHRTSGDDVYNTVSNTVKIAQCCLDCFKRTNCQSVTVTDLTCKTEECQICLDIEAVCDRCSESYDTIYPQLRPCLQCLATNTQCKKLAVLGLSMDCESNNAHAMRIISSSHDNSEVPHMALVNCLPDAVHAGKKLYRASANWWLFIGGYRVNNCMIRSLRQFERSLGDNLRQAVGDKPLRNRDRMDYGSILQGTDKEISRVLSESPHYPSVTMTVLPDPFFSSKTQGILKSISDICLGKKVLLVSYLNAICC